MRAQRRSCSAIETMEVGSLIGGELSPGDVVCLDGELGTGKTVLARGIASARGHGGAVTSPTFTIIRTYPGQELCHVDAFRLQSAGELIDAGIDEFLDDWICAVEWAENVRGALPDDTLDIEIRFGEGADERLLTVEGTGRFERIVGLLRGAEDDRGT